MELSVPIPDDFARQLRASGDNIERRVLVASAVDEFRLGRLTRSELKRVLGFATRGELDTFLLERGVAGRYSESDLAGDRTDLQHLGL